MLRFGVLGRRADETGPDRRRNEPSAAGAAGAAPVWWTPAPAWFAVGSRIVYRVKTSTKGSPAVEIKVSTPGHGIPPSQKVHLISKGASE
jgi:H+/Cl- antiporter ClcA